MQNLFLSRPKRNLPLKPARVTANDVAEELGVSRSTVSRAFTPDAFVHRETREKVLKAAKRLGYQPNAIAQALTGRVGRIVGIIMGDLQNPFHATIHSAVTAALQARNLTPITAQTDPGSATINNAVETFRRYQVDVVLLTSMQVETDMIGACKRAGLRPVLLNRADPGLSVSSVNADLAAGARMAGRHLAERHCRNVVVLEGPEGLWTTENRSRGHHEGLLSAGLSPVACLRAGYTYADGQRAADTVFGSGMTVDGILASNDLAAIGFLDRARTAFDKIAPRDFALVGFDDIPMAAWDGYDLTTVRLPVLRMGDRVAELAGRIVDRELDSAEQTLVPCTLVKRGSA